MKKYSKEYQFIRPLIIHLYDYSCVSCGVISKNLEVHHVDKNTRNNHFNNLLPLCKNCHNLLHRGIFAFSDFEKLIDKEKTEFFFKSFPF